jgi:hypothetical protein
MKRVGMLLLMALTAAPGCAPSDESPTTDRSPASAETAGPGQTARRVVAELLGIDADEVKIVSVEAREFSDSSLDCPQPGMSYLQVITPGHRVLLEAEGRRFDVRTSGGQGRICRRRKPGEIEPEVRSDSTAVSQLAESARRQLAAQLDADTAGITVIGIRNRQPGETLTGCNQPCSGDEDCGYVVQLAFQQRRYTYLADGDSLLPCPAIETS